MKPVTLQQLTTWSQGQLVKGDPNTVIAGISTDSRSVKTDDLFIALRGERFDAHQFLNDERISNSKGILVSDDWADSQDVFTHSAIIRVDDTLLGLQRIAHHYRMQFSLTGVAITGSNGKTTTKDIVAQVLNSTYPTLATKGNLNNHIGLPLTLLNLDDTHQCFVTELGMNHLGEIDTLANICQPDIGIITNVGPVHLEFLKTIDNVYKAKLELAAQVNTLFVNGDDPRLVGEAQRFAAKIITFGRSPDCDIRSTDIDAKEPSVTTFRVNNHVFDLPLPGRHNVHNALAAIAVGRLFEIDWDMIAEAFQQVEISDLRSEIIVTDSLVILNDSYNANPVSMRSALQMLGDYPTSQRRIAVLGDMYELGEMSRHYHREIGSFATHNVDSLIAVGTDVKHIADGAIASGMASDMVFYSDSIETAINQIETIAQPQDVILVKGSRGTHLEDIVDRLKS